MFQPKAGQRFLDLTYGAGGHTARLLSSAKDVTVHALDRDPIAYEMAVEAASTSPGLFPLLGKFSDLPNLLSVDYQGYFDGILIDCGCSSMQFDEAERGFSISRDGPLDMRMDNRDSDQPTAAQVLAHIDEDSLHRILKVYGEEKQAKKIARAIIESRYIARPVVQHFETLQLKIAFSSFRYLFTSLKTTKELAELIETAVGFSSRTDKIQRSSHVATKTFQALRILINDELNELDFALHFARRALKTGGRIVTITFHSLEDRIVKNHLQGIMECPAEDEKGVLLAKYKNYDRQIEAGELEAVMLRNWESLSKHVVTPTEEEVTSNPRSRSAKLRAAIKLR